jgi:DNA-binding transcriptional regulator YdaS (Cro superfamily)
MSLREYLRQRGMQARLARLLAVNPVLIHQWAYGKRPIPIHRCADIERVTAGQVTRQDLRPEDWFRIWPELATTVWEE